ncbi:MAG: hypothetical protein C6W59_00040, partial [Paenibacillaceae bacterium]
ALLLWIADIAVRRLSLPWGRIAAALAGEFAVRRGQGTNAAGAAAWTRHKDQTRSAGEFYAGGGIRTRDRKPRMAEDDPPNVRAGETGGTESVRTGSSAAGSAPAGPAAAGSTGSHSGSPNASRPDSGGATGSPMERLLAAKRRGSNR